MQIEWEEISIPIYRYCSADGLVETEVEWNDGDCCWWWSVVVWRGNDEIEKRAADRAQSSEDGKAEAQEWLDKYLEQKWARGRSS